MLYAVVARSSQCMGGKVASFDRAEALKVRGVRGVSCRSRALRLRQQANPVGGIAVIARNTWAAIQGRQALKDHLGRWPTPATVRWPSKAALEESGAQARQGGRNDGDFAAAAAGAARRHEPVLLPHLAHATMEPPARPYASRTASARCGGASSRRRKRADVVAKRLGNVADDVTVHVTLLAVASDAKSMPDYAVEAAVLSKAMDGKPVKVTWTREDRPARIATNHIGVGRAPGGCRRWLGKPVAWLQSHRGADHHLHVQCAAR